MKEDGKKSKEDGRVGGKRQREKNKRKKELEDKECKKKRKKVRWALRSQRKDREQEQDQRKKKKYKEVCERKKKEGRLRSDKLAEEARTEGQVWELINKKEKRRKRINGELKVEQRGNYLETIL